MQLANTMYVNWWNKIVLNIPLNGSQFHHTPDSKKLTSNLFESGIIFVSVCSGNSQHLNPTQSLGFQGLDKSEMTMQNLFAIKNWA